MSAILKKLGKAMQSSDLFAAPILLRYKTDQRKTSRTGGCVSLVLIILLVVAFYNSWLNVFHKVQIKSETEIIREMDPSPLQINSENFILAVGFYGIDVLATTNRYYDIDFIYEVRKNGAMAEQTKIQVVGCQPQHFSSLTGDLSQVYEKLMLSSFICLPKNLTLTLSGKWSSDKFAYIRISVKKCTFNCASAADLAIYENQYLGLSINYYFVNSLVNPTLKQPISLFLDDKNYNMVNKVLAIDTNIYVSEYNIKTDESLLPIQSINETSGIFMDRTEKQQFVYPANDDSYVNFHFRKSDQKIKITRSYRKVDDLFSYLGGLFGIVSAVFGFIIVDYNKCLFELQMSNKVFRSEEQSDSNPKDINQMREAVHCKKGVFDQSQISSQQENVDFNFWIYLKYNIARVIFFVCPRARWVSMHSLLEKMQETQNQMNIDVLLQKISYYERAFQCLFDPEQITLLMLQQKISISELKDQRAIMDFEDEGFLELFNDKNRNTNKIINAFIIKELNNLNQNQEPINEMSLSIYEAISKLKQKSKSDQVSKKILRGIRQDLLSQYQKYIEKHAGKLPALRNRISMFSQFTGSGKNIESVKKNLGLAGLFSGLQKKTIQLKITDTKHENSEIRLQSESSSRQG